MNKKHPQTNRRIISDIVRPKIDQPVRRSHYTDITPSIEKTVTAKPINVSSVSSEPPTVRVSEQSAIAPSDEIVKPPTEALEVEIFEAPIAVPEVDEFENDESLLEDVSSHMKRPSLYEMLHNKHAPKVSLMTHVEEMRKRAMGSVLALLVGGVIGYHFQEQIIAWLVKPLGQQLFYTSPTGGFDFLIKICLFFGFLLAIPVIIYNFIRFIAPAIPGQVAYKTSRILLISTALALSGVAFAYYISLPSALHFLGEFSNSQITSLISAQEYFNFVMIYLAGFAALFQMPLIFSFINKVVPLHPASLMKKQRVVILVSFIIAAVLTPTPDPINQTLMAVPIIGLYQTSIGVVWQNNRKKGYKQRGQTLMMEEMA